MFCKDILKLMLTCCLFTYLCNVHASSFITTQTYSYKVILSIAESTIAIRYINVELCNLATNKQLFSIAIH